MEQNKQAKATDSQQTIEPYSVKAYHAQDTAGVLTSTLIQREAKGPYDVKIKIQYCGICHTDLHMIKNEWGASVYPVIPGHEIVGFVEQVGPKVTKFKPGDRVAVGVIVMSCLNCNECSIHDEQYCTQQCPTYNGFLPDGTKTYGGFAAGIVTHEYFVLSLPANLDMAAAAPLLCAGITTYSPLKSMGIGSDSVLGIVGMGGLGHIAIRLAKAMGAHVTVISTSSKKSEDAKRLGADNFLISTDKEAMAAAARSLTHILSTVCAKYDLLPYLQLLRPRGKMHTVGLPPEKFELSAFDLTNTGLSFGGSYIGGIKETQEMLDMCGEKGIVCDVEVVPVSMVNEAIKRLEMNDVKYRFVLDIVNTM